MTLEAHALVEAAPDGIVTVGAGGVITLVNRQVETLFGYRADELVGRSIDVLVPDRLAAAHAGHRARYEAAPRTRPMGKGLELCGRRKDGSEFPVEISLSPMQTADGRIVTAIIRDVSDRRDAERRLRASARYFEVARDLLCTAGADGRLLHLSGSWESALGWTVRELRAQPLADFVHPDDRPVASELLTRLTREGGTADACVRIAAKDGRWRWFDLQASGDPAESCVYASARDVTERRAIESELGLHSEIVSTMAEGVVLVDARDRRVVYANPRLEEMFGHAPGNLDGVPLGVLLAEPAAGADAMAAGVAEATSRGEVWRGETLNVKADGSRFWCSAQVSQFDHAERGRLWVVVLTDVTERKRVEQEREQAALELLRSNAELEQFAYAASHDLSEPLRVVSGFADILARRYRDRLDDDAGRFLDAIQSGVDGMQALIDALLAYSRAGRSTLVRVEVAAEELVGQAVEDLSTLVAERGAAVEVGTLPVVRAEPNLVRQLFQNLIANAVKFTTERPPRVEVTAARADGGWRFSVADNGDGVDPEHVERIFEPFQRLHSREVAGTGIGLATCKRIVERHGGGLRVDPRAGGGSVFSFTLPDVSAEEVRPARLPAQALTGY